MDSKTKWLIKSIIAIIGGVMIHFTFGYFYTVSNMVPYIMGYQLYYVEPELSPTLDIWISAISLAVQGITMPLGGITAKRFGFRPVVIASCLFMSVGVMLSRITIMHAFGGFLVTYCLLLGAGLGFGYSVVIQVVTSWYPNSHGLLTGVVVGGFGLGALAFTPIQTALINPENFKVNETTKRFDNPILLDRLPMAFIYLGIMILSIQTIGCILVRAKPKDDVSEKEKEATLTHVTQDGDKEQSSTALLEDEAKQTGPWAAKVANEREPLKEQVNMSPAMVLRTPQFYLLWFVMFCNIIPITIITGIYKQYGQTHISDDAFLSLIATFSSIFNACGRIIWGLIVDRLSFKIPLCIMLGSWSVILITFPFIHQLGGPNVMKALFAIWVFLMYFMLSGVFTLMPNATASLFGKRTLAINYGLVFNAFAFGSVMCAGITSAVGSSQDQASYTAKFVACGCVCLVALFTTLFIPDRNMRPRLRVCDVCVNLCPGAHRRAASAKHDYELTAKE